MAFNIWYYISETFASRNTTRKHSSVIGGLIIALAWILMIDVGRCSHIQRRRLAEDEVIRTGRKEFFSFISSDS